MLTRTNKFHLEVLAQGKNNMKFPVILQYWLQSSI